MVGSHRTVRILWVRVVHSLRIEWIEIGVFASVSVYLSPMLSCKLFQVNGDGIACIRIWCRQIAAPCKPGLKRDERVVVVSIVTNAFPLIFSIWWANFVHPDFRVLQSSAARGRSDSESEHRSIEINGNYLLLFCFVLLVNNYYNFYCTIGLVSLYICCCPVVLLDFDYRDNVLGKITMCVSCYLLLVFSLFFWLISWPF